MERRSERIFGQRYGCRPVKIDDLNMHLMCVLCGGYYIDATTIIECLHSFCRSCIVRYLETSSRCPICDVLVHKAQPLLNIRLDHVLQGLVYKLVPGLLTKEMNSRREFYSQGLMNRKRGQPQEDHSTKIQSVSISEEAQQQFIKTPNLAPADSESLSISLEYLPSSKVTESRPNAQDVESRVSDSATDLMDLPLNEYADVRYLLCPAGFTVGGLKKFIRAKFDLPLVYQIDIFHGDECLENHFSMLDVAFIFQWQKKAPLHLRYSVGYVPRTKRKLTTSSSTRRQNSKENETLQSGPDENGEGNGISSQHELTKSHHSICPSKTSKHANARTRPTDAVGDHRNSTVCKDNGSTRVKQVGYGVMQDEKSSMSSRGSGSGYRDIEEGEQHDCLFEDQPKENPKTSMTKDKRVLSGLTARGNSVSKDTDKVRVNSEGRIAEFQEFSETQCNRGNQTHEETGGQTQTTNMAQIVEVGENIVHGTTENAELTIDLTGEDLNCSVATLSTGEVNEVRSGSDVPSDFCPESVSRVVGSVTFMGNGSATVLSSHNSVLCSVGQIPVNGDIAKSAIALPCINAFKTLSCGLHSHQLSYASDSCSQIVGESVMTDDVMKIISTPEVTIVPSFGVQLIYSPDSVVSTNPICGVIQLPEAPISVTSDALTRAPTWSHSDVATNGIMNDADFQRLCEGKTIHAEKDFGGCFEHFVMPNLVESVGGKMSDEVSLSYAVSLDSTASGPLPCVFVAQATGHQPQNSWGLPESSKDAETVDWGLCYPVAAAEFGTASLASISDEKLMEQQPECSFVCVTSNSLPGSTTKPSVAEQLWSQGPYTDRNGTLETDTVIGSRGEMWAVESRQGELRAVKMCIVEPQAVKRKAENDWAVEPKEAKTSYMEESNTVITQQMRQMAVETRAEGNTVVEPQAVETQTMGLCAVESMPELWAVEPRTMEPRPVEPKMMGPRAVEQRSMESVTVGLLSEEIKTTSSCEVESSPEETQGVETKPKQLTLSKLNLLEETSTVEPEAVESISVELQAARSQNVDSWAAEESLVGPDDAELVAVRTTTLEQLKSAERRETGVNHTTAETQSLDEDETNGVCPNALPTIDSSLTAVSEDSGTPWEIAVVGHREDTSVLQQNQHTAVEVNSADYVVENAIPGNRAQQLFELPAEEKFLFSGDNLAKFHDTSTNWSCSKEENQPTSATVNKDPNSESMPGLKSVDDVTVVPKTENSSVSASSEISSSLENEAVGLSTKPEDISYKVEDEPVSLEEEELVIDMMEQKPVSAKAEDVPAPSDDADNVDILNNSYSDLSNRMLLLPSSEPMLCSTETTKRSVSAATEDIPVSSTCVNDCPVSALDAGLLLVDDSMSVSVTDDHVMVCIRGKEPPSVAEEGNSEAAKEIPVSNDESGIPVLESCNEVPGTYDCKRTEVSDACNGIVVSDACNKITASDDCSEVPISDSCNIRPVTDVCDKVQVSVTTWNLPFSAVTDHTAISDAGESDHCVSKDIPIQSLMLFDDIQVPNTTREDIIPCISNDSAVSNVPEEIPVSAVMVESELTNSSVGELPISVPIPTLPNYLPTKHSILAENIPVSLTSSLETVPICSSSLETTPFCTSVSLQSVVYPLAISSLADGYSNHVAQDVAIENQVMSTGEELDEEDLSHYISACHLNIPEDVPVSEQNLALGDINLRAVSVEMSWKDGNIEDKNSERLDFADKVKANSVEERLVTDEDVVPFSLPLEFDNGRSITGRSDQNFGLLDMGDLGEDRVPDCGSKIIDSHMVTDNDQKSVENRVNLSPSGDSVATCAEKREKNEDKEEDGLALSQRLLCSGSIIPEDEQRHNYSRSITRVSHSFSFSNTSSGSLDCAVPSRGRRRRSRSLDESLKLACAKQDNVELQSNRVPPIDCVLLKEKTVLLNRSGDTVGLLSERVSGHHTVACGDKSSVPDELTVLNPSESCVGHVPVSAFRIQPFVTNMQDDTDTVNVSPMNDVVGVSDEHADTCKFITPDTIAFCDASCDNLKSNDSVLERSPGETEMSDENPVNLI